ncbi:MAG: HD domain-containing protein [Candidatus Pacebacteria bacterium]|nr:HD domain-containing protein [Candidatus Paceibacterota bacterium]
MAVLEDCNPEKSALITLIHDNGEARVGDQDKVQATYINAKEAEKQAFTDQLSLLPKELAIKWQMYIEEYDQRNTPEGVVAKDADWLELAFEAKEKLDIGYKGAQNWLDNIEKALETESAKKIFATMKNSDFNDWYKNLKTMTYEKLS